MNGASRRLAALISAGAVGVLALFLFLRWLERRAEVPTLPAPRPPDLLETAPPPQAPTVPPLPVEPPRLPAPAPAPVSAPRPPAFTQAQKDIPGCPTSTPEEIVGSYRRLWGPANLRGIEGQESEPIEDQLVSYYACLAAADRRADVCARLGTVMYRGAEDESLAGQCRLLFVELTFFQQLLNKLVDPETCRNYFAARGLADSPIQREEFCSAAEAGYPAICPKLAGSIPLTGENSCHWVLPEAASDCAAGDSYCLQAYGIYRALSSRDPKTCPKEIRGVCEAFLSQGTALAACDNAAGRLRKLYCKSYQEAYKRSRGQIGMTDEDLKRQDELNKKLREERQKTK